HSAPLRKLRRPVDSHRLRNRGIFPALRAPPAVIDQRPASGPLSFMIGGRLLRVVALTSPSETSNMVSYGDVKMSD
ncbi:MAG: hypothetical protein ACLQFT_01615, partial [Steroidobacteraceae bacterium]